VSCAFGGGSGIQRLPRSLRGKPSPRTSVYSDGHRALPHPRPTNLMRRFFWSLLVLPVALTAQQAAPSGSAPAAKPQIARVVVLPLRRVVNAGETLQLRAEARDAAGNLVEGVSFRFAQTGAHFEGAMSNSGLVTAGATG